MAHKNNARGKCFPYRSCSRGLVALASGVISLLGAVVCIILAWDSGDTPIRQKVITAVWGIRPPLWFLLEHYVLLDNWDDPVAATKFVQGRDLWTKMWAGVAAVLAVLLFKP